MENQNFERRIALVGSSGGGTATAGHTDIEGFVDMISRNLSHIYPVRVKLTTVLFVFMDDGIGFDGANGNEKATLLYVRESSQRTFHNSLDVINKKIQTFQKILAQHVREGNIDGLITVSCKPSLFLEAFQAVAAHNLPVTGTGGSSLSELSSSKFSLRLIGNAGGSVATTPETKSISFASAFAKEWDLNFDPNSTNGDDALRMPQCRSVLNSCLPVFWGVCLLKRLMITTSIGQWIPRCNAILSILEAYSLPGACSVNMATSRRQTASAAMAAILAASSCPKSVIGGLLAGYMAASVEKRLLYTCLHRWNLPATMTNLVTSGMVGIVVAVVMSPVSPYLSTASRLYRDNISTYLWEGSSDYTHDTIRLFLRTSLGCMFCYGSKVGWCKWKFVTFREETLVFNQDRILTFCLT
jgi:hypothetical protein